jgi:hypothetical protein
VIESGAVRARAGGVTGVWICGRIRFLVLGLEIRCLAVQCGFPNYQKGILRCFFGLPERPGGVDGQGGDDMVMKYTLVSAYTQDGLVMKVTANLKEGWQLQGGVSVCPIEHAEHRPGTLMYSQAMIFVLGG